MNAIQNAVIHQDYQLNEANVSVEVYCNRVEISDPGELPPGMKPEDMGKKSVRRNKLLADLFHRIGEVEKVGSGILRMEQALKDAGVEPFRFEFTGFCTIIFDRITDKVTDNQRKILMEMMKNNSITNAELSKLVGIPQRKINSNIAVLKEKGILRRHGKEKGGHWEVVEE